MPTTHTSSFSSFSFGLRMAGLALAALLSACGGGGGTTSPADATVTIRSFSVNGTGPEVSGVVPINASVNNGEFSLNWDVDSDDPVGYWTDTVLSADTVRDSGSAGPDVVIHQQGCLVGPLSRCSGPVQSFNCRFTTDNKIICDFDGPYPQENFVGNFIDALPKSAYLIFRACTSLIDKCQTQTVAIELQ